MSLLRSLQELVFAFDPDQNFGLKADTKSQAFSSVPTTSVISATRHFSTPTKNGCIGPIHGANDSPRKL